MKSQVINPNEFNYFEPGMIIYSHTWKTMRMLVHYDPNMHNGVTYLYFFWDAKGFQNGGFLLMPAKLWSEMVYRPDKI